MEFQNAKGTAPKEKKKVCEDIDVIKHVFIKIGSMKPWTSYIQNDRKQAITLSMKCLSMCQDLK